MSLVEQLDELDALSPSSEKCAFARRLESLPEDKRKAVEDALRRGVSGSAIARVLSKNGIHVPASTLRQHRRSDCVCARG